MTHTLILGGPGTGKTATLLTRVERYLATGVPPHEIAFVTFTRAAASEAKERACRQFGLSFEQLPYFRTIHSLCFHGAGARRAEILKREHLAELTALTGEEFPWQHGELDEGLPGPNDVTGEHLLHLEQLARVTQTDLKDIWRLHAADIDWFRLKRFADAYSLFKQDSALLDFTDLLERYGAAGYPVPVSAAIIDEGQDLTRLQWRAVERAFKNVNDLLVAGDDDQSIHEWAGAAVAHFLDLPYQQEHLGHSHRLSQSILVTANAIAARMQRRYPKPLTADSRIGLVERLGSIEQAPLEQGEWLILARTRHMVREIAGLLEQRGLLYASRGASSVDAKHARAIRAYESLRAGKQVPHDDAALVSVALAWPGTVPYREYIGSSDIDWPLDKIWHDALIGIPLAKREYYLSCRRAGERLLATPRIRLETIHGSKGLEAPNVLLFTDITERIERGMEAAPDAEHRVFYVGATRAREALYIVEPQGNRGYVI